MVVFQPEQTPSQLQVAPQRPGAGAHRLHQGRVNLGRDRVAVQRAVQGRGVAPGPGQKPAALEHAAVDRRVGVLRRPVGSDVGGERAPALGLHGVRREQLLIRPGREGDLAAVVQRDGRKRDVRGAELGVDRARRLVEARREGQEFFPLLVQHVPLATVGVEDGETVDRELRRGVDPAAHGLLRHGQQLGREPRHRRAEASERRLHALQTRRHVLVARVGVAPQLRVSINPILEHADLVEAPVGREQRLRAVLKRALAGGKHVHALVHLRQRGLPGLPRGIDGRKVPLELVRYLGAVAGGGFQLDGGGGGFGGAHEKGKDKRRHAGKTNRTDGETHPPTASHRPRGVEPARSRRTQ